MDMWDHHSVCDGLQHFLIRVHAVLVRRKCSYFLAGNVKHDSSLINQDLYVESHKPWGIRYSGIHPSCKRLSSKFYLLQRSLCVSFEGMFHVNTLSGTIKLLKWGTLFFLVRVTLNTSYNHRKYLSQHMQSLISLANQAVKEQIPILHTIWLWQGVSIPYFMVLAVVLYYFTILEKLAKYCSTMMATIEPAWEVYCGRPTINRSDDPCMTICQCLWLVHIAICC